MNEVEKMLYLFYKTIQKNFNRQLIMSIQQTSKPIQTHPIDFYSFEKENFPVNQFFPILAVPDLDWSQSSVKLKSRKRLPKYNDKSKILVKMKVFWLVLAWKSIRFKLHFKLQEKFYTYIISYVSSRQDFALNFKNCQLWNWILLPRY